MEIADEIVEDAEIKIATEYKVDITRVYIKKPTRSLSSSVASSKQIIVKPSKSNN